MKRKLLAFIAAAAMAVSFAGCSSDSSFDAGREITVITREEGSGTRGAFTELFEIEDIVATAEETSSTGVMLASVEQNSYAIGYISMGALKDTVKALQIDGAEATAENVENGTYKISRPFNIAYQADSLNEAAQDFIDFILSTEGQAVVEEEGYIKLSGTSAYEGAKPSGSITVGGSSSVSPLMTALKEAYEELNPNAAIEIITTDSTTGMNDAASGTVDIGMASRNLKDSELEAGLTPTVIATDGVAVIVNPENPINGLTCEQVKAIYSGEATVWADVDS